MGAIALANAQTSRNPHSHGTDDVVKTNPQGKSVGNPHNIDQGQTNANPHHGF